MVYIPQLDRIAYQHIMQHQFNSIDYDVYYDFSLIAKRLYPNISEEYIDIIWIMAKEEFNAIYQQLTN